MSDRWWTDGSMVNVGLPGDEGFVGDAATSDDAQRIVDAHNDAAPSPALTREALAVALRQVDVLEGYPWENQVPEGWRHLQLADAILVSLGTPPPAGIHFRRPYLEGWRFSGEAPKEI